MSTLSLTHAPSVLPLYVRAAAPLIPGASLLPFVPGGGGEIPEIDLRLEGVNADSADVAAYAKVCGFALRDHLPPTYPHVLAFPLHMAVMADGSFPFGAIGLVHLENRIEQYRPIGVGEEMAVRVHPTKLQPHPKGQTFSLLTEVSVAGEPAWTSESSMLRRGKPADGPKSHPEDDKSAHRPGVGGDIPASAEWRLGSDLGRRYASVSGDRNPIHMHSLTAKPLGFPGAIAHGMWTKARCLAALESRLPDAFGVDVRFRKPILLPGRVEFASAEEGGDVLFAVRDAKRQTPHLDGRVRPLGDKSKAKTGRKKAQ
ncbi:MAG TPA: MaoC/PaaZ C-terminal domain-containing protein [Solirubrobacterales bacterium]|nr:MaoC/PaaZ C-terminal domain-containing protein [Solirubrobacterales bacterium]